MAPYTMSVMIVNQTPLELRFSSWAAYSTDGTHEATCNSVGPRSTARGAFFSKGGGTDGLFAGATFALPDSDSCVFIYARMPASSGGVVSVRSSIAPGYSSTAQQLVNDAEDHEAGSWHNTQQGKVNGVPGIIVFDVLEVSNTYPDATCKIRVQAFKEF